MTNSVNLKRLLAYLKVNNYRHITPSPATHQIVNARPENALGKSLVDIFGWSRPFVESSLDAMVFEALKESGFVRFQDRSWVSDIRVSTIDNLYFVHSAYPTYQVDAVFFGPDTYRFINALNYFLASELIHINRAIDICTGCGPAAITLAKLFPDATIFGVDINDRALELAKLNANVNEVENAHFIHSDLLKGVEGNFDFITANPPYLVDGSKRAYRHGGGKYGYQLSLDIIRCALLRLTPGGTLLLYTGVAIVNGKDLFFEEVERLLSATQFIFQYEELDPDVFGEELLNSPYDSADRIAAVILTVTKPKDPSNLNLEKLG